MNLPMLGKNEYSMHGIVTAVMPHAIRAGTAPNDFSPVGEVVGALCANEAYKLVPVEYIQGGKTFTSWKMIRQTGDISKIMAAHPAMRMPNGVQDGWTTLDGVRYTVNRYMLLLVEALIALFGKATYTVVENKKEISRVQDRFLMEGIQSWEWEAIFKVADREISFVRYPDSRGGRVYACPAPSLPTIPTTESGDSSAFYQMAEPIAVSAEYIAKVWIPAICTSFGVTEADVIRCGDFDEAVRFAANPTGKVRGIGKKKRNLLSFLAQCHFVAEARKTGQSFGYMPSKDGHANGWLMQFLAIGAPAMAKVLGGQKVHAGMLDLLKIPSTLPAWAQAYVGSTEWVKAGSTPVMYTSRFVASTFLYGPASAAELLDEEGYTLHPKEFASHVVQRKYLNPAIKQHLAALSDEEMKAMAEMVSDHTLSAIRDYDPFHWAFTSNWLAHIKMMMGKGNVMECEYRGYPVAHFSCAPDLSAFPANEQGERDLPQISITIPRKYRDFFDAKGWPTRYQPTMAPFTKAAVDGNGDVIIPYQPSTELNRTDTPNGSLGRIVTLADSGTLSTTIQIHGRKHPGSIVYTRHDALTTRPDEGYLSLDRAYTAAMYEECKKHLRPALQGILPSFAMGPMLTREEVMAGANRILV